MPSREEIREYNLEVARLNVELTRHQIKVILWERKVFAKVKPFYCEICDLQEGCRRIVANRMIRRMIMRGETCPDLKSYWSYII